MGENWLGMPLPYSMVVVSHSAVCPCREYPRSDQEMLGGCDSKLNQRKEHRQDRTCSNNLRTD